MRSTLVIKIIKAFNESKESFITAVNELAKEEAKKGNNDLANKILLALNQNNANSNTFNRSPLNPSNAPAFSLSSASVSFKDIPKDKDSALGLFEIIEPEISLNELVFSEKITNTLDQVVMEWNKSQKLLEAGISPTRRILFYGPPGCGKTAAGLALAKKLELPVAYVRLDSLFSSYLGQTSSNLRLIFDSLKSRPMALFLDEFDAVAKKRDDNQEIGEIKRIVISLLQNFDFLPSNVLVLAATNHQHLLDSAVWRRFDLTLPIESPNMQSRIKLISQWIEPYKSKTSFEIEKLAEYTVGLSGSRLKDLVLQTIKTALFLEEKGTLGLEDFHKNLTSMETYDDSFEAKVEWARKLQKNNLPIREIAEITGIPKSTLSDHLKIKEEVK